MYYQLCCRLAQRTVSLAKVHGGVERIEGFEIDRVRKRSGKLVHYASGTINMDAGDAGSRLLPLSGSLLPFGIKKMCDGQEDVKSIIVPLYQKIA